MNARYTPFLVVALLAACGGDSDDPITDSGAGADTTADAGDSSVTDTPTDADLEVASDVAPDVAVDAEIDTTRDPSCAADWVVFAEGSVVDAEGAPVVGALAQLCVHIGSAEGNLVCLRPEPTSDDGTFQITAPASARCVANGSLRVFAPNTAYASTYCGVATDASDGTLTLAAPIVLFETTPATTLPAYEPTRGERTVAFAGGLEVDLVPDQLGFTFTEQAYGGLGAVSVPTDSEGLCFVSEPVDSLWAFAPEANSDEAAPFRVPNTSAYPAGASVELYVLGGLETTLPNGDHAPETEWVRYGTATVSEDGATIAGELPALTWLGLKLAEDN
ncbi:MAG: hypothetical protein H6698_02855 [Myxococcales bacterium]|nr:hypothetical protein [Myxococcales bacterium]MCB9533254.1 hypothetical protein [Myxococcales bacterium]